jgi:hypothetical protein
MTTSCTDDIRNHNKVAKTQLKRTPTTNYSCRNGEGKGALYWLRAAQSAIGLADKHDPGRLEAACAKAITAGDPSYRTVQGILVAGAETDQLPAAAGDGGVALLDAS